MKKRDFLGMAAAGAGTVAVAGVHAAPGKPSRRGPVLLTVTGALARSNRGAFEPSRDILMGKHKLSFKQAYGFDYAALAAMPAATIKPTLEYDARVHTLQGPLLAEVLVRAGAPSSGSTRVVLRAIDGYSALLTLDQIRKEGFIVATHMDGEALALGGLGPLWALPDADRVAQRAALKLADRFAGCPWALYHIDVLA